MMIYLLFGADSLKIMQILTRLIDKEYNLNIQDFYKYKTIRKIYDNINASQEFSSMGLKNFIYYDFDDSFSGKKEEFSNILLTGSTGFLGSHILYDLIKNTEATVYCLIREKNNMLPEQRLRQTLEFYFGNELNDLIGSRIIVVHGNIINEKFDLLDIIYKRLGNIVDVVVHSAALVKHYGDVEVFEQVNTQGTANMIKFCKEFNIKLNYISTTSVFGVNAKETFDERSLYVGQEYNSNVYINTKFESEYLIWKGMKNGLNAIVYRLGNIAPRYNDGLFQQNKEENAFLNRIIAFIKLKFIPESMLNLYVDISPVDICSKIITQILMFESSYGKAFNVLNPNKLLVRDLIEYLVQKGYKITTLTDGEFETYIKGIKKSKRINLMGLINDIGAHYAMFNIDVKCDFTVDYLNKINLKWPEISSSYILNYVKNYK